MLKRGMTVHNLWRGEDMLSGGPRGNWLLIMSPCRTPRLSGGTAHSREPSAVLPAKDEVRHGITVKGLIGSAELLSIPT